VSTITVQLLPDDDARCQIVEADQRCERYSVGAKLTGQTSSAVNELTIKLCNDHAAAIAARLPGSKIIGSTESSS
jgi:hypothetical protein